MLVTIIYSLSAGPLALAKESLLVDSEPFFVLNSDVICSYPFKKLLQYHKEHGKEGTIVVSILESLIILHCVNKDNSDYRD